MPTLIEAMFPCALPGVPVIAPAHCTHSTERTVVENVKGIKTTDKNFIFITLPSFFLSPFPNFVACIDHVRGWKLSQKERCNDNIVWNTSLEIPRLNPKESGEASFNTAI